MVECRCEVLNNLTGRAAVDYARRHLEEDRSGGHGRTYYTCPETGISWAEEPAPDSNPQQQRRRLRRTDRR